MNLRLTIALLTVLVMVAGYIGYIELKKGHKTQEQPPFLYNVNMDSIKHVTITLGDKTEAFKYNVATQGWVFDDGTTTPVNNDRWSGVTLLLSGPRVQRILFDQYDPNDLPKYGLDNPSTEVDVTLDDGRSFQLYLGAKTPDGGNYYAIRNGSPQLALVNSSWGEVLTRLVSEPPYLPTPTPSVTPCVSPTAAVSTTPAPGATSTPSPSPTVCVTPTPAAATATPVVPATAKP